MRKVSRHEFLEQSIARTGELLQNKLVIEALGQDRAWDLARINKSLFIPNLRWGRVCIPREYTHTNKVPITAVDAPRKAGQSRHVSVRSEAAGMTPEQQAKAMMTLQRNEYKQSTIGNLLVAAGHKLEEAGTDFRLASGNTTVTGGAIVALTTHKQAFAGGADYHVTFKGRPIIGLAYDGHPPAANEGFMVYEYTHALQRLGGIQLRHADEDLRSAAPLMDRIYEHEAYDAAAKLTGAICAGGLRPDLTSYLSQAADWDYRISDNEYSLRRSDLPGTDFRPEGL